MISVCRLEELKGCFALALNEEYLNEKAEKVEVKEWDRIAVIPPLSGG